MISFVSNTHINSSFHIIKYSLKSVRSYIFNFMGYCLLQLINGMQPIFENIVLQMTKQKKIRRGEIWRSWGPQSLTYNSIVINFLQETKCASYCMCRRSVLLKVTILAFVIMQLFEKGL